jgi:hypothetical protein
MDALRHALSSALSGVFFITLAAVAVAWLTVIFLKEIPLRGRTVVSTEMTAPQPEQDKPAGS